MAYRYCPKCGRINHRKLSRICPTERCSGRTIEVSKNLEALARKFASADYNVYSAIATHTVTVIKKYKYTNVCVFEYIHTGFYTLKEAIQDEIDKMIEWIDNQEGNIAVLRLAGFWL